MPVKATVWAEPEEREAVIARKDLTFFYKPMGLVLAVFELNAL
jgi:hypothetical protein